MKVFDYSYPLSYVFNFIRRKICPFWEYSFHTSTWWILLWQKILSYSPLTLNLPLSLSYSSRVNTVLLCQTEEDLACWCHCTSKCSHVWKGRGNKRLLGARQGAEKQTSWSSVRDRQRQKFPFSYKGPPLQTSGFFLYHVMEIRNMHLFLAYWIA